MTETGMQGQVLRWRRGLAARLARPRTLWLDREGLRPLDSQAHALSPADWAAAHAGEAVTLIASEHLLQHLLCEPGLPLADEAALQAYARQLLAHYFGAPAQRWALAGWASGERHGASALVAIELGALQQGLQAQQVALRGLRPAWAAVLQRVAAAEPDWLKAPQSALAWVEGGLLTWLVLRQGRLAELRHLRLAAPTAVALAEVLTELATSLEPGCALRLLGYGLDAEALPDETAWPGLRRLSALDQPAPAADCFAPPTPGDGLPAPDFIEAPSALRRLAWPLAITGALVLATAAWDAWDSHAQWREAAERVTLLQARLQRQASGAVSSAASTVTTATSAAQQRAGLERLRSATEVQALLQQAWGPLLSHVEQAGLVAAPDSLNWLGLDFAVGRQELRLEGLASDKSVALHLVERLAAEPGWGDVVLNRFQSATEGQSGQRFELSAKLATRAQDLAPDKAPEKAPEKRGAP